MDKKLKEQQIIIESIDKTLSDKMDALRVARRKSVFQGRGTFSQMFDESPVKGTPKKSPGKVRRIGSENLASKSKK